MKSNDIFKKLGILFVLTLILSWQPMPLYASNDLPLSPFDPLKLSEMSNKSYENLQDYTATFLKKERIGNKKPVLETIEFKFRKPDNIYMKWIKKPNKGQEVLYCPSETKGKMLAHKGGFLGLVSVKLNPRSKLAIKNQHHPITHAGIGATSKLVYRGLIVGLERKEVNVEYKGIIDLDGRETLQVEAIFPEKCEGITYEVEKKKETLWDIAEKFNQDMYVIQSRNKKVDSPTDIKKGGKIFVPYHYSRRTMSYIDKETLLLVKLEIYDWEGNLYEMYHFKNLRVNVGLVDKDFSKDNSEYNF